MNLKDKAIKNKENIIISYIKDYFYSNLDFSKENQDKLLKQLKEKFKLKNQEAINFINNFFGSDNFAKTSSENYLEFKQFSDNYNNSIINKKTDINNEAFWIKLTNWVVEIYEKNKTIFYKRMFLFLFLEKNYQSFKEQ